MPTARPDSKDFFYTAFPYFPDERRDRSPPSCIMNYWIWSSWRKYPNQNDKTL